jgi:glycogen synthase
MKHLILCNEYPPTPQPPGGIGTYVYNISKLLAEAGETVHVIAQSGGPSQQSVQVECNGRLVIHRVPFVEGHSPFDKGLNRRQRSEELDALFQTPFPPQCFSWQASLLAEQIVEEENIDVIESQEFQAPLYYFQLRRALGLGPKKTPPCIIHLHSPTEFICLHNGWDINYPFYQTAKRLEDYCIGAADALLCPSRFFAQQAEHAYQLAPGSVEVIPLPIGNTSFIERAEPVWSKGTICYVGRLEERKGVVDWIDAAVAVAKRHSEVKFEFIGANLLGNSKVSGEKFLSQRIPKFLQGNFIFRGSQSRTDLPRFLQQARIAVVPSRWENFPNTCVEAMCSGLPVLATREGGMVEMIDDGKTGWLVRKPGASGLEEALERALSTPSFHLEAMGRAASTQIRSMCDNKAIVEAHIAFRHQVIEAQSSKSTALPFYLPLGCAHTLPAEKPREVNDHPSEGGIVVVINFTDSDRFLQECLQCLSRQTKEPLTVILMQREDQTPNVADIFENYLVKGWQILKCQQVELNSAQNEVVHHVLGSGLTPIGFSFLNPGDLLHTDFVETCERVLNQCPQAGIISCWSRYMGRHDKYWLRPCPSFPYQWMRDDVVPFSVFRTEALAKTIACSTQVNPGYEMWDRSAMVMSLGWAAVTVPSILSTSLSLWYVPSLALSPQEHIAALKRLHQKFKPLTNQDADKIAQLALSEMSWSANSFDVKAQKLLNQAGILAFYSRKVLWYLFNKIYGRVWNFLVFVKYEVLARPR